MPTTAGPVLTTYVRAGEIVQPGQPLYRIADLDTLVLRAYLTGAYLTGVVATLPCGKGAGNAMLPVSVGPRAGPVVLVPMLPCGAGAG